MLSWQSSPPRATSNSRNAHRRIRPNPSASAPDPTTSKLVTESEYHEAIRVTQATKHPSYSKTGDTGVIKVWVAPNGRIVA